MALKSPLFYGNLTSFFLNRVIYIYQANPDLNHNKQNGHSLPDMTKINLSLLACIIIFTSNASASITENSTNRKIACCNWEHKPDAIPLAFDMLVSIELTSSNSLLNINDTLRPAAVLTLPKKPKRMISIKSYSKKGFSSRNYLHPVLIEIDVNGEPIGVIDHARMEPYGSPQGHNAYYNMFAKYYIHDETHSIIIFGKSNTERARQNLPRKYSIERYDGKGVEPEVFIRMPDEELVLESKISVWLSNW